MKGYSQHRFHTLDGMRGIAAILVMLYHYYDYMHLPALRNEFLAVDFFFILSGFVIRHAYGERLRQGMPAAQYLARRVARLYPTVVCGILLGLPFLYLQVTASPIDYKRRDLLSSVISNLAMLPTLSAKREWVDHYVSNVGLFPTDTPLWSIFFEMVGSIGFIWLLRLDRRRLLHFAAATLGVLALASLLHGFAEHTRVFDTDMGWAAGNFLGGFPRLFYGFSMGMLLYAWRFGAAPSQAAARRPVSPWLLYAALALLLGFPWYAAGLYDLLVIGLLAPLLVWFGSMAECRDAATRRVSEFLGWISFPLYCLHVPVLEGMRALDRHASGGHLPVPPELAAIPVTLLASVAVGLLVERLALQKRITRLLDASFAALAR